MVSRRNLLLGGGTLAVVGIGTAAFVVRNMGSMGEYEAAAAAIRAPLPSMPQPADLVRYATLAASGHNTQPWRFRIRDTGIDILPDLARRTAVVDPDDHHLYASLGCAAENLSIAAAATGRTGQLSFDPAGDGSLTYAFGDGPAGESVLFDAIPLRQSTRGDYDGQPVAGADLQKLAAAAAVPGVDMVLLTERTRIDTLRDLVLAGNAAQLADPDFVRELKASLRFSPRRAIATGDGLFSVSSGNPALPEWLGPLMFDLVFTADAENARYAAQIDSSAGVAVFVAEKDDPEHWVRAGRACQRFALQASALGIRHAFVNQPVEVASFRPELAALVGLPGRRPNLVMRFGYGPTLPYSMRRPVPAVLA